MATWKDKAVDIDYILDSGLLFHLNHSVFHPIGIAMTIKVVDGKKQWGFKDCRNEPESLIFDTNSLELGKLKLSNFLRSFGDDQMARREKKLGWGCQPLITKEKKNANPVKTKSVSVDNDL